MRPSIAGVDSRGFNPRARGGRDLRKNDIADMIGYRFNPRARGGRDYTLIIDRKAAVKFQSTRPRGARHGVGQKLQLVSLFQSTRPRGARPGNIGRLSAPRSFNPRARGGRDTQYDLSNWVIKDCFNPRARGGRDAAVAAAFHQGSRVSIHAPAGGATKLAADCGERLQCFNPRARGGRDIMGRDYDD